MGEKNLILRGEFMINPAGGVSNTSQFYNTKEKNKIEHEKQTNDSTVTIEITNKVEKSPVYNNPTSKTGASSKPNIPNSETINSLWQETQNATNSLRNLVKDLLKRQGIELQDVLDGKTELVVDEETRVAANQSLSEDGEFGVKSVTTRIIDFAKALANGDKTKIPELRDAIEQGFEAVEEIFGELPEISRQTRELVRAELDKWETSE